MINQTIFKYPSYTPTLLGVFSKYYDSVVCLQVKLPKVSVVTIKS